MKRIIIFIFSVFIFTTSNANEILNNLSTKVSEFTAGLIPGEGLTEVDIEFKESQEPDFTILGVRDINKTKNSNFFTQFSLHNNDVQGDERYIGNLGFGYRVLTDDNSMMLGINSFYDRDISNDHARGSIGLEARGSVLEFNLNQYYSLSRMEKISGEEEQSLGGIDYSLSSQIPYMPWAKIGWIGYKHEADKASVNTEGDIYSLEMALTPSLQLDIATDESNHSSGDSDSLSIMFIYPPRDQKATLADGLTSNEIWNKESMEDKLSEKVKRNNNIVIEVQGSVIITSK